MLKKESPGRPKVSNQPVNDVCAAMLLSPLTSVRRLYLNPLDFYLWGHIKTRVYHTKPATINELKQLVHNAVRAIPADHLQNAFHEFERRIRLTIVNDEAHVEVYKRY